MMGTAKQPVGVALDLMLKTMVLSTEFNGMPNKNWEAVARLVPGSSANQCKKRYEELLREIEKAGPSSLSASMNRPSATSVTSSKSSRDIDSNENKYTRPPSAKQKGAKPEKDYSSTKIGVTRPNSGDQGPVMVIHVCDEAKNLKQDFYCPRDLLVAEMRYFAEYLSTDAQRWDEVDISVHCDVQIFDWLMKYVKRTTKDFPNPPKLEPNNVISILISSDFLKMDSLVQECVKFCHKNMTEIVSTPCNMNCINDTLAGRIAGLFSHTEADEIKDRKDKFKSKLFAKKVEKLFDVDGSNGDSPDSAATLYRCQVCRKLLTKNLESKVRCLQSRMTVDKKGDLCYSHRHDATWDVNDYLVDLKNELKSWRDVYWRVWGTINYLTCSRCNEVFPCCELAHCQYHPEAATFTSSNSEDGSTVIGTYPCCGQKTLRFDPTQPNKGCKVRDHVVSLTSAETTAKGGDTDVPTSVKNKVYDDLLSHRDAISVPYQRLVSVTAEEAELNVFAQDEKACESRMESLTKQASHSKLGKTEDSTKLDNRPPQPRLEALTVEREVSFVDDLGFGESDDEVGDEEEGKPRRPRPRRSRVTVDPEAILVDAPDFGTTKNRKWDSTRSLRWNQDAQREEDQRRMLDIVRYLTQLRQTKDKPEKTRHKEYAGGVLCKLEAQWRAVNMPPPRPTNAGQLRNKTRLTQLKLN